MFNSERSRASTGSPTRSCASRTTRRSRQCRPADRPPADRLRRAADRAGRGGDRERVLRRDGRSDPRGADDAGRSGRRSRPPASPRGCCFTPARNEGPASRALVPRGARRVACTGFLASRTRAPVMAVAVGTAERALAEKRRGSGRPGRTSASRGPRGHDYTRDVETISWASDEPDASLLPLAELTRTVRLRRWRRDGKAILSYGSGGGYTPLWELIGAWFNVHPFRVVLTNGWLARLLSSSPPTSPSGDLPRWRIRPTIASHGRCSARRARCSSSRVTATGC